MLDVGQGLSVLLQTRDHAMLFDTGVAEGGRWVLPQLQGLGVGRLDMLVLSHNDKDHVAAAADIYAALPVAQVLAGQEASLRQYHLPGGACQQGQSWVWDGIRFDVLWPPPGQEQRENNAYSCVLRVASWHHAIMLTGDAPMAVEDQLVEQFGHRLQSSVLVAGHHGSKTSSSALWLQTVQPRLSVLSAGFLNRYRHPHPRVLQALQQQGPVLRTDADGLLTIELGTQLDYACYRQQAARYWRAAARCGEP